MGFVYVLTNKSFPGLVKIGMTNQSSVSKRVKQLNTGVPTPFDVAYEAEVLDPRHVERTLHKMFDDRRVQHGGEFFQVSITEVRNAVRAIEAVVAAREDLNAFINGLNIAPTYLQLIMLLPILLLVYLFIVRAFGGFDTPLQFFPWLAGAFALPFPLMFILLYGIDLFKRYNLFKHRSAINAKRSELNRKYGVNISS